MDKRFTHEAVIGKTANAMSERFKKPIMHKEEANKELFGKCEECGYEGTVETGENGKKVCNLCLLGGKAEHKYVNQIGDKIICPWCQKEVKDQQKEDGETFTNGGEQTDGEVELWHEDCAKKCEAFERENGLRM